MAKKNKTKKVAIKPWSFAETKRRVEESNKLRTNYG